ncbi:hypothetical protein ACJMQP_22975 [Rhodopseudomonas palustris]
MDTNATRDGTGLADLATASVLIGTDSLPLLSADEDISRCYPQLFAYFAQFASLMASEQPLTRNGAAPFTVSIPTRIFAKHDQIPLNARGAPSAQLWE